MMTQNLYQSVLTRQYARGCRRRVCNNYVILSLLYTETTEISFVHLLIPYPSRAINHPLPNLGYISVFPFGRLATSLESVTRPQMEVQQL
jgi:hypothetical protein